MENGQSDIPGTGVDSPRRLLAIGWREYVDFPDWAIRRIKVKIDTGARTSALGVAGYDLKQVPELGMVVEMRLALSRKNPLKMTTVRAPVLRMVAVRNTSGIMEERPLIETTIRLGPAVKRIPLTIASRASMRFCMILGRKALEGDFMVDVSKQYLLRNW